MLAGVVAQGRTNAGARLRKQMFKVTDANLNSGTDVELCSRCQSVINKLLLLLHHGELKANADLDLLTVAAEAPFQGHCGAAFKSQP